MTRPLPVTILSVLFAVFLVASIVNGIIHFSNSYQGFLSWVNYLAIILGSLTSGGLWFMKNWGRVYALTYCWVAISVILYGAFHYLLSAPLPPLEVYMPFAFMLGFFGLVIVYLSRASVKRRFSA